MHLYIVLRNIINLISFIYRVNELLLMERTNKATLLKKYNNAIRIQIVRFIILGK